MKHHKGLRAETNQVDGVAALAAIAAIKLNKGPSAVKAKQACELLGGISRKTLSRWVKAGHIRSSKAMRHTLIPVTEIERFLKETM